MKKREMTNWEKIKASIKDRWDRITDDDIEYIDGDTERLNEKFKERYGKSYNEIERDNMYKN